MNQLQIRMTVSKLDGRENPWTWEVTHGNSVISIGIAANEKACWMRAYRALAEWANEQELAYSNL